MAALERQKEQAEAALRRSQEQLRDIIDSIEGIVWEADAQSFQFSFVSPRAERLLGYPLSRWIEEPGFWMDRIHPDDRDASVHFCQQCVREQRSHEMEYRMIAADGRVVWLRDLVTVVVEKNAVVKLRGIMVDITERKSAEAAVRRSEELFRAVVEDQTEMIVRWKPDGTRTFVNEAYCRVFGARREDLIGTSFLPLVAEEYLDMIREKVRALTPAQPVATKIHESLGPNGERLWQEWTDRGLFDAAGRLVELQSTGRDITERRKAEQRIEHLNRVYAVLTDINQMIVRDADAESMLTEACRIAVEKGRFRTAWIGLRDPATGGLRIAAHAGADEEGLKILQAMIGSRPHEGDCAFTAHALQTGEHGVCNDIARDPQAGRWSRAALQRNYRAMASLPLKAGDKVIGTFNLYSGEPGFFDADELRLLDELAVDISFALEIVRRETERRSAEGRHALQRNALIGLTGRRDFKNGDVTAALWQISETAARTLGVSRVSIWRYNANHSAVECVDLFELEAGLHSSGAVLKAAAYPAYFRALAEVDVIAAHEAMTDARTCEFTESYLRPLDIQSMLDVPIQLGGALDGVLCHEQIGAARQWTADEKTFAVAMANLVSLALEGWERTRAERAVAEKTEVLATIFDNAPVMLCLIDTEGRMQMANRELERVTGWTLQEIRSHTNIFEEWYPRPEDRAQVMALIRAGTGQFSEFQTRVRNGSTLITTFASVALSGGSRLGIGMDITARKGSERQLAAFATLGRRLGGAATAPDAARIIMETADDLFGWDACWLHMYDPARDHSSSVLNIDVVDGRRQDVPPAFATGTPAPGLRRALEKGPQLILREKAEDGPAELLPFGDTGRRSASLMVVPVRHGGEMIAAMSIQSYSPNAYRREDLAALEALADYCGGALAQIRAGQARRESEQRFRELAEEFRLLIENASDLITVLNGEGIIRFQSPSADRILGYTPESMVGRNALDLIHPDDVPKANAALARSMTEPATPVPVEYRIRHNDGSWHTMQSIGRNIPHRSPDGFIVINSRDVTDNRKLEEQFRQSQKMEAIGQLAGGVAHDFNNILTVIQGYGSLLMMTPDLSPETAEASQQIVQASERAANLTRQLLAFSRRQVIQTRRLDLNEVVISLAKMLQRILGEDVRLQLNLYPGPVLTRADAGMLDQVIMNLVVNARDAMPRGGQLTIETTVVNLSEAEARAIPDASAGRYASIRVTDMGTGIPQELMSRIFEPFFTTKEPGKGTGLGLATVFGIIKQHHGSLTVESELGKGSTFHIWLPALTASAETSPEEKSKPKPRGGNETILIVEDEPAVRALTRVILERQGYRVLEAAHGVEALKVWEKHRGDIQLLLTDIVMPEGLTGRELASRLQAENRKLRVIFTSGYSADIAGRELSLQEGQNFIQKPSPPHQLLETVRRCLDS